MEAPTNSNRRFYRPELDAVRFLAFFFVFLHHTLPSNLDPHASNAVGRFAPVLVTITLASGFGMNLFFTLSAFLICELLIRERESTGSVGVKQFYIRRILRIWPLYYFGLALGAAAAILPGGHPRDLIRMTWFVIFMGAWQVAIHGPINNPMNPLWSISVEEQFYLLAPWTVRYFNRRLLYGFCVVLLLFSNGWLAHLSNVSASDDRIWFDSFVHFESFAAGILLCLVLHGRVLKAALWQRVTLLFFAIACWFIAVYTLHVRYDNPGVWNLIGGYALAVLGSVLILAAFLGVNRELLPGWVIYLGRISFGLYVYHKFAIFIVRNILGRHVSLFGPIFILKGAVTLGLTALMAAASYRYLETPFLKMKKRHSVIESQPVS